MGPLRSREPSTLLDEQPLRVTPCRVASGKRGIELAGVVRRERHAHDLLVIVIVAGQHARQARKRVGVAPGCAARAL